MKYNPALKCSNRATKRQSHITSSLKAPYKPSEVLACLPACLLATDTCIYTWNASEIEFTSYSPTLLNGNISTAPVLLRKMTRWFKWRIMKSVASRICNKLHENPLSEATSRSTVKKFYVLRKPKCFLLWDLRFSQRFFWRFSSSVRRRCVFGCTWPGFPKNNKALQYFEKLGIRRPTTRHHIQEEVQLCSWPCLLDLATPRFLSQVNPVNCNSHYFSKIHLNVSRSLSICGALQNSVCRSGFTARILYVFLSLPSMIHVLSILIPLNF
jgi:hypothetical protein